MLAESLPLFLNMYTPRLVAISKMEYKPFLRCCESLAIQLKWEKTVKYELLILVNT